MSDSHKTHMPVGRESLRFYLMFHMAVLTLSRRRKSRWPWRVMMKGKQHLVSPLSGEQREAVQQARDCAWEKKSGMCRIREVLWKANAKKRWVWASRESSSLCSNNKARHCLAKMSTSTKINILPASSFNLFQIFLLQTDRRISHVTLQHESCW